MASRSTPITAALEAYIARVSLREPDILQRLRAETATMEYSQMQISPEQGQFMALLARAIGARRCLEIGVFTGYSALVVAMALPPDGRLVACDKSAAWTSVAQRYWREASVAERIDLRLGTAADTLAALVKDGEAGTFDYAFIDADKENYGLYYERALELVRPGGLILFDNTLWSGRVADPTARDYETEALRKMNDTLARDPRIELSLLPMGDGLTVVWKRC